MSIIPVINLAASAVFLVTVIFLIAAIRKKRLDFRSGIFLIICIFIILLVTVSNVLEHAGIDDILDRYEEFFEILIIPFFLLFIYSISSFNEIEKRKRHEERLQAALTEREILLREIHHRVKNNIQIISSLLQLQLNGISNEEASRQLRRTMNRIRTLGLVYKTLYQSEDFSSISMNEYLAGIVENLKSSYCDEAGKLTFVQIIDDSLFPVDIISPIGLVVNEIVSNSILHGFKDRESGEIGIIMGKPVDGIFELKVYDTGCGLPGPVDLESSAGLGMQLIKVLIQQIRGEVSIIRAPGTIFKIIFQNRRS